MPAPKGTRPPGGSRKGCPNKVPAGLRDQILGSLEELGGQAYLVWLGRMHPPVYGSLLSKTLPAQVTGADDAPLFHGVTLAELNKRIIGRLVAAGMSQHDAERAFLDG